MKAEKIKEIRFSEEEKARMKSRLINRKKRSNGTFALALASVATLAIIIPTVALINVNGEIGLNTFVRELYGANAEVTSVRVLDEKEVNEYRVEEGNYFVFTGKKGDRSGYGTDHKAVVCKSGTENKKLFYCKDLSIATTKDLESDEFSVVLQSNTKTVNAFYRELFQKYKDYQKTDDKSVTDFKSVRALRKDFESYLAPLNLSKQEYADLIGQIDLNGKDLDFTKKYEINYSCGYFTLEKRGEIELLYDLENNHIGYSWAIYPVVWNVWDRTVLSDRTGGEVYCYGQTTDSHQNFYGEKSVDISLTIGGETLDMHYDIPRSVSSDKIIDPFHKIKVGGRTFYFCMMNFKFYLLVADGKGDIQLGGENNLTYTNSFGYTFSTTSQETLDFWKALKEMYQP